MRSGRTLHHDVTEQDANKLGKQLNSSSAQQCEVLCIKS